MEGNGGWLATTISFVDTTTSTTTSTSWNSAPAARATLISTQSIKSNQQNKIKKNYQRQSKLNKKQSTTTINQS